MPIVRVYTQATADNSDAPPPQFDVAVNENNEIVGRQPTFGMQGHFSRKGTEECYPFVLYPDGSLDYGGKWDHVSNERIGSLNIGVAPLAVGLILTLTTHNYRRQLFRVSRIDVLPII